MAAQEYYNPTSQPSFPQQQGSYPSSSLPPNGYVSSPAPTQGPPPPYSPMPGPSQPLPGPSQSTQQWEKPPYGQPPQQQSSPQFSPSYPPQQYANQTPYGHLSAQSGNPAFRPPQPYSPNGYRPQYQQGGQASAPAQCPPSQSPHRRSSHDHVRFKTPSPPRSRSRSRSRSRRRRHHRNSHSNSKGTKDKGTFDTFLGAGGGAIIGDAIFPGLGTVGGALLGGYGGHRHAEKRKDRNVRRDYDRGYDSDSSLTEWERRRRR